MPPYTDHTPPGLHTIRGFKAVKLPANWNTPNRVPDFTDFDKYVPGQLPNTTPLKGGDQLGVAPTQVLRERAHRARASRKELLQKSRNQHKWGLGAANAAATVENQLVFSKNLDTFYPRVVRYLLNNPDETPVNVTRLRHWFSDNYVGFQFALEEHVKAIRSVDNKHQTDGMRYLIARFHPEVGVVDAHGAHHTAASWLAAHHAAINQEASAVTPMATRLAVAGDTGTKDNPMLLSDGESDDDAAAAAAEYRRGY